MDYTACMGLRSTRLWKSLMNTALGIALTSETKHKELWSDPDSLLLWMSDKVYLINVYKDASQGSQTLRRHLHEKKGYQ